MYQLYTHPDHYEQLAVLLDGAARNPTDGDESFSRVLAVLNSTNEIITLASSIGQPHVKGKRALYIHMATTREGTDLIARFYSRIQRRLYDDWNSASQPIGVMVRPSAVQIHFNYYESHGLWFQAMTLQCCGVHTETNQRYIIDTLYKSLF